MFFDREANFKGVGIRAILVSKICQHYPVSAKLRVPCTNNMAEYEDCILGLKMAIDMNVQELPVNGDSDLLIHQVREEWATKNIKILPYLHHVQELRKRFTKTEFQHVPRNQNEFVDALATLSSMIQHPDKNFIDPIPVKIYNQLAYCSHVEEEADGKPWFHDIKEYLEKGERNPNLEAELDDAEWVKGRYEQLALIDGKRMNVVFHGQLYQNRMSRAFNKRVKPR
ncbi:uncharacterized protein [Nicotiana sylvestris]|uniref:uncharacterized protein n=1 Tax=Nicotiana sylvestris TaxID=4096 RepID=UPI00388C8E20